METCSQHNSASGLLTFGAVAMNMHFQTLVELKGGAPIVVLYGEPDVGKTTIANAAMSPLGIEACSFRGMRREYFVHLASQTSLGLMYDDPNKIQEVENIIIDFYNGMTRGSFKRGLETPRCGFLLACNFSHKGILKKNIYFKSQCFYYQASLKSGYYTFQGTFHSGQKCGPADSFFIIETAQRRGITQYWFLYSAWEKV